ncbi:SAM-dependent methyltransferase [Alphaproteobacteria bacterium LSUCC0744]
MSKGINTQAVLAMRGAGYYSERTAGARHVINDAGTMVIEALAQTPQTPRLRIADFGAADGGTSREMWDMVIGHHRANGDNRQIEMLYTDLASNDFSTLFRMMQGMQGDPGHAYQSRYENVFVHGCGTGFHRQLMADASLNLGFSATAMHYVSVKPMEIPTHVHAACADPESRAAYAQQAAQDWEHILLARAAELIVGGRFICLNFGIDEQGRYLGNTGGQHMFDHFHKYWLALFEDGSITADEYKRASFAQYYRTMDEFCAPFYDPDSAVRKAGLKLKSCHSKLTKCPYEAAFLVAGGVGGTMSNIDYANSLIPTMRSWSETVFRTALEGRDEDDINQIVNRFYDAYRDDVAANPSGHAMDYVHIILDIEKTV